MKSLPHKAVASARSVCVHKVLRGDQRDWSHFSAPSLFIQQLLKAYCAQPMFKMQCVSSVRAACLDQAFRLLSFLVETGGSQNGPAASVGVGGTVHVNGSLVQTMTAHGVFGESVPLSP